MSILPARTALAASALALVSALPAAAQATLWTVDDDGPADFADLQAAIDGAAPGDVLSVAVGSYPGPFVVDKGLTLITSTGVTLHTADPLLGIADPTLLVRDLPADQAFVLHDGQVFNGNASAAAAIVVRDCAGPVWFQDVFVDSYGAESLHVEDSASVVLNGSRMQTNVMPAAADGTPQPGAGARVDGGGLHLHDSDLVGSHGVFQLPGLPSASGPAPGGDGLLLLDGSLRLLGGSLSAGSGGSFFVEGCQTGADGGTGLRLPAGPGSPAALVRDALVSGGSPGFFDGGCAPVPAPGVALDASGGPIVQSATPARQLSVPGLAGVGEAITLEVDAEPGDTLWFFSALQAGVAVPAAGVQMHLDTASLVQLLVLPAPPSGDLSLPVTLPSLPAGLDVLAVPLQVFALDDQGGRHETGPGQLVIH